MTYDDDQRATNVHQTHSARETLVWARTWGRGLAPGDVVALSGDLGAGKTCFVQGLAAALGVTEPVVSPTYALIHEYQGRIPLYHVDLYRVRTAVQAKDLGLDEYLFGTGVTAIEWADKAESLLPAGTWLVRLAIGAAPEERTIVITRLGESYDPVGP